MGIIKKLSTSREIMKKLRIFFENIHRFISRLE